MRHIFIFTALILAPFGVASAHVPLVVEQSSLHDITPISDPTLSQAFYGKLNGFPETYEIRAKEPFHFHAEVLIPDIDAAKPIVNGIIIREIGKQGKVTEVTRMLAKDAQWESFYEAWGGDSYRRGAAYDADVEAGVYRIELSTPDNEVPYVLVVGTREESGGVGYFELVKRISDVKVFFGKPRIFVVQSPYVYVPLIILALALLGYRQYRKKQRSRDDLGSMV